MPDLAAPSAAAVASHLLPHHLRLPPACLRPVGARRTATSSMTSVPKPLKFLRPHYDKLKAQVDATPKGAPNRQELADVVSDLSRRLRLWLAQQLAGGGAGSGCSQGISAAGMQHEIGGGSRVDGVGAAAAACPVCRELRRQPRCCRRRARHPSPRCPPPQVSVLAMTSAEEGSRETLKYKLEGVVGDVSKWGHEYIRHLAGERQPPPGLPCPRCVGSESAAATLLGSKLGGAARLLFCCGCCARAPFPRPSLAPCPTLCPFTTTTTLPTPCQARLGRRMRSGGPRTRLPTT